MFPSVALAYRPFVSTDAAVADAGEVEVELGYAGFRRDGSGTTIVAPALIANLGVARDLEVVGEFKLVKISTAATASPTGSRTAPSRSSGSLGKARSTGTVRCPRSQSS